MTARFTLKPLSMLLLASALSACALGPDYQRPQQSMPEQFKQMAGWKVAAPADEQLKSAWWQLYNDALLNQLVDGLELDNQNLAAAQAQYRQAQALVGSVRSRLLPDVGSSAGMSRGGQGEGAVSKQYDLGLNAAWELDIWGKLRRNLEASDAEFKASAAELAALRLSLQSELVQSYLQLRVLDEQKRLLEATVQAYQRSLQLTQNQYEAGIVPRSDVAQAMTQLKSAEAQAIDLNWQRAQYEHAIAVLVGKTPAQLSIEVVEGAPALPSIPVALPSALLERRPDIAAAERRVMAANARIGVAQAAWFPDLTLSASAGYRAASFANWIEAPSRLWSLGPQLALSLFDGGARRAELERSEAAYDQTVAQYRQTVLDSLREVEDNLVQLEVLKQEAVIQQEALEAARESLRLVGNQYRAGTVDFNSVVNVQATALSNERASVNLQGSQLLASVRLIAALGGGWQDDQH